LADLVQGLLQWPDLIWKSTTCDERVHVTSSEVLGGCQMIVLTFDKALQVRLLGDSLYSLSCVYACVSDWILDVKFKRMQCRELATGMGYPYKRVL
jgi:hypothetical protein